MRQAQPLLAGVVLLLLPSVSLAARPLQEAAELPAAAERLFGDDPKPEEQDPQEEDNSSSDEVTEPLAEATSPDEETPAEDSEVQAEDTARRSQADAKNRASTSGNTGVEADLWADSLEKRPVVKILSRFTNRLFYAKDQLDGTFGIQFGVDYNFLNQYASFSSTDDQATSGNIRFYGTWDPLRVRENLHGWFVFRIENRHTIGPTITPRDLGFDAGSALSTASFKDFDWGITSLYWQQRLWGRRVGLAFGQMDPGDFMDAYPLLSAWTAFMSDAFFNNPAEALPQQGVGFVARVYLDEHYYVSAGIHDALGNADGVDVAGLFDGEDYFYWWEVGWSPSEKSAVGDSIHFTYWEQDPLAEKETSRSRGFALSVAPRVHHKYQPFIRVGYSDGDAALMRRIWTAGIGIRYRDDNDLFGAAVSWGAPVDQTAGSQMTNEVFYRLQFAEHIQITPALQVHIKPAFNDIEDVVYVGSVLRMRLAF